MSAAQVRSTRDCLGEQSGDDPFHAALPISGCDVHDPHGEIPMTTERREACTHTARSRTGALSPNVHGSGWIEKIREGAVSYAFTLAVRSRRRFSRGCGFSGIRATWSQTDRRR